VSVIVTLEKRFYCTPDGAVWTETAFPYSFWTRYLDVFDNVRILARARTVATNDPSWTRVDGPGVSLAPIPYYLGPWQYVTRIRSVVRTINENLAQPDVVIMRVPSQIATTASAHLKRTESPYGLEVVGDPYDLFAPGASSHPLRSFFRWWYTRQLEKQCARAAAVAYVSASSLSLRYPPAPEAFTTSYSSVELPSEAIRESPRGYAAAPPTMILGIVGSLELPYKGVDVLLEALSLLHRTGLQLRLRIIGDGRERPALEAQAAALNLAGAVDFVGSLPSGALVREELDALDLFVLPSRVEGLPRAMIEAMARSLPCIGSNVGGIPELLPPEAIVPMNDADALAVKIRDVATDPERMDRMAAQNLARSRDFVDTALRERRIAFYRAVKERTERWQAGSAL